MLLILAAAGVLASPFATFQGRWDCEGRFIASGKSIASVLMMETDRASGVFVVHHDDAAPMPYHSIERWTADTRSGVLRAAVTDQFIGLRTFRGSLMQDVITFTRPEQGQPQERFVYTLKSPDDLQVDWSVSRSGHRLVLGDTLTCRRRR